MKTINDLTQQDEDRYQLRTYAKLPISIIRGKGCYVYDEQGEKYLDLYSGHAVTSTGHCHPRVVKAIRQQAAQLIFYSNVAYNNTRARSVKKLLEIAGDPYHQVFLTNSGSESNENAIKLARAFTGRTEILSLEGSFHGRTYGSLSSTGISKYRNYLNTPVPQHRILPMSKLAQEISEKTAAVLIEPIQSMGGMVEITPETLHQIYESCKRSEALLIYDEVQSGVARTGTFLYAGREEIYPDLVSLAKGIASGFPCGALLVTEKLAKRVHTGDLGATFGGGPLACAAMEATLDVISQENLAQNALKLGSYLRKNLMSFEKVETVLGRGLLLGIKLRDGKQAKDLHRALFLKHILSGTSMDPQVLRLMPPLILTTKEADIFLEVVGEF